MHIYPYVIRNCETSTKEKTKVPLERITGWEHLIYSEGGGKAFPRETEAREQT